MPGSARPLRITPMQKLLGDASTGDIATLRWAEDYGLSAQDRHRLDQAIGQQLEGKNRGEQRTELVNLASSNQTRDRLVNEAVRQQAVATGDEVVKTIDLFTNPNSPLTGDIQFKQMPVLAAFTYQFEGRPFFISLKDSSAGGRVALPNFMDGYYEATSKHPNAVIWGDDLLAPYGKLSLPDLQSYTNNMFAVGNLLNPDCRVGVCNTFHAAINTGLPAIEDPNAAPYVHLIKTTTKAMVEAAKFGDTKPVLLATPSTVKNGIYTQAIKEASGGKLSLIQIPAPAFADAVNNGDHLKPLGSLEQKKLAKAADEYVKKIPRDATSVWLCCTHYPALTETIHAALVRADKGNIKIVDPMRDQGYAAAEEYWTWKLSGGPKTPGQPPFDTFMVTSAKQEDLDEIGRLGNVFVNRGDPTKPIVPIISAGDYGQVTVENLWAAIDTLPGGKPLVDPSKLPSDTQLNPPNTQPPWDGPNPQTLQVIKNNEPPSSLVQFQEKYDPLGGDPTLRVDPNPRNDGSGQAAPNTVWSDPMLQNLTPSQRQAVEDSYVKYREAGGTKSLQDFLIGTADDPGVVKLFDEQKYLRGKSPSIPEIAAELATEKVQQRGTNEPTQTTAGSGATSGVNSGGPSGRTEVKIIPVMQGVDPFIVNHAEELRNNIPDSMGPINYEGAKMAARKAALTEEVREVIRDSLWYGSLDLGNGEFLYAYADALYTQPEGRGDKILSISKANGLNVGNRVEVDSNWMIENALGETRIPLAAKIWDIYAKTQIHGVPTYEIRAVISSNLPSYVNPKTLIGTDLWGNPITYKPFPHETDVPTADLIYGRNLWELTKALEKDLVTPYEIRGFYTEQNIRTGKFGGDLGGPGPMVEAGEYSGNLPRVMPDGKYDYQYVNVKNFEMEDWLKGLVDTVPLFAKRDRYKTISAYQQKVNDYRAEANFDAGRSRFWLNFALISGTGVAIGLANLRNAYTQGGIVGLLEDLRDDTAIIEKGGNDPTVGPRMAQKIRQFIPVAESTVNFGWNGWQTETNTLRDAARLYDQGKIAEANVELSKAIKDMESKFAAGSYTFTGQITLYMAQTQRDTNEKYGGVSANGTPTAGAISAQGGVGADGKPLPNLQVTQKALQNQTLPPEVDSLYRAAVGKVSTQNVADVSTLKTDIDIINGAIDSINRLPPGSVSHPKTVDALASLRVLAVNKQGQIVALEQGSKNRGLQLSINNVNQELAELRLESDREYRKIAAEVPGAILLGDGQVVAPEHEITRRETAEASARANLDNKIVENARNQTLLREGAISQQVADKGTLELEQARQSHASALANLRAVTREDGTSVDLTKGRRLGLETIQEKMKELRQLQNQIR
jgi:glutamate racemase/predicted negative regulator of RcsB-dependent stress response